MLSKLPLKIKFLKSSYLKESDWLTAPMTLSDAIIYPDAMTLPDAMTFPSPECLLDASKCSQLHGLHLSYLGGTWWLLAPCGEGPDVWGARLCSALVTEIRDPLTQPQGIFCACTDCRL